MKQNLTQKQVQKMALTPQMRQSIHILQLPILELKNYLSQEIEENPTLEDDRLDRDEEIEKIVESSRREKDSYEDYYNSGVSHEDMRSKQNYLESLIIKQPSLQEFLLRQLGMLTLEPIKKKIGEYIIGNIDENGYFQSSIDEVALSLEVNVEDVEDILSLIQTFEPLGIGAINLKDCLEIQLRLKGREDSLAYKIVDKFLMELAKNKIESIAKSLKISPDSVRLALKEISSLESKPGRSFSKTENRRVLPDILVEKKGDDYEIIINNKKLPVLKISALYRDLLSKPSSSKEVKDYLKERIDSARWLVKAVGQRQETIMRVARCILDSQKEFFEHGRGHLKPLTMKEVADKVGRNESTISRVVNNKYIQTPFGIFELSYFFNGAYKTSVEAGGEAISTDTVKNKVAMFIEKESPDKPLSDSAIVSILKDEGINVARRTIAKYREELKVLPSHLRKRRS
ncbi:MAG: RNA polymerase factor sigma-54 [Candidatus Omnitrophota bacterium]